MHVILWQGISNSNMKGQTEAMPLIQCPPPLFDHGYSHYSLLPLGNSLFHIQIGFLPQTLPLEVECAQNRGVSFQFLACKFLCSLGLKHNAIGKNALTHTICSSLHKLPLINSFLHQIQCDMLRQWWGEKANIQMWHFKNAVSDLTKKIQTSPYFLPPQHSEQQHPSQNWSNFVFWC